MARYVGLDVSIKTTAICVVDGDGEIVFETTAASDPKAINEVLREKRIRATLIGLEAGPLYQWLYKGLRQLRSSVVCIETRRMRIFARVSHVKTDRIDARMIAEALRAGVYRPVHVKSQESQEQLMLLVHRLALLREARGIEQVIRGTLRPFGLKVGNVSSTKFEARVLELTVRHKGLRAAAMPVLSSRAVLLAEYAKLDRMTKEIADNDPVVRLLMTMPGVGPLVGLFYKVTIDEPARFAKSSLVASHLGLTPRIYQSGETSYSGRITRAGDKTLRSLLFMAAQIHLNGTSDPSELREWGLRIAERRGKKRAIIAVARRMAVILHRMWSDGTPFNPELRSAPATS